MSTKLDITRRRQLFSSIAINLLVGIVVLLWGGQSTQAQTAAAVAPEPAVTVDSSITLTVKSGSVSDPNGTITVSGSVIVNCRRVLDTTGASPALVMLDFDFSKLQGTIGNGKSQTVFVTGDNHATEIRPLQASDTIIVTSPYYESTKDVLSARSMLVTATLNFDINSGKLTGGSINVGNNIVTTTAVGSFTPSM